MRLCRHSFTHTCGCAKGGSADGGNDSERAHGCRVLGRGVCRAKQVGWCFRRRERRMSLWAHYSNYVTTGELETEHSATTMLHLFVDVGHSVSKQVREVIHRFSEKTIVVCVGNRITVRWWACFFFCYRHKSIYSKRWREQLIILVPWQFHVCGNLLLLL